MSKTLKKNNIYCYKKTKKQDKKQQRIITNDCINLKPKKSTSEHSIKLQFPDILVSQCEYTEGPVGLTFIYFKKGAKTSMSVRGGWPGYINCLSTNDKQMIDGINIAGGSLLGLESTTGLTIEDSKKTKYKNWKGFNGAIIYSNNLEKNKIYPDKELGRFAYNNFSNILYNGQVGAGLSASHGQGWGYKEYDNGIKILALCVNNAYGSVYNNNDILHMGYYNKNKKTPRQWTNTTIIVIVTNINLDDNELKQMNDQVNVSIGDAIKPFNTFVDGDVLYTCSTQSLNKKFKNNRKLIEFYDDCGEVLKNAIYNSIL